MNGIVSVTGEDRCRTVRWPLLLTLAIVLVLSIRIFDIWPRLPPTMASHFAANGRPNDFMSKGGFFAAMALFGGGPIALLFVIPLFLNRLPASMINLPNREYWLATDDRRIEALDRLASFLGWMALATAALIAVAIELAIQANVRQTDFANGPFAICLLAYFAFVIVFTVKNLRALAVPEREQRPKDHGK
jgi:uncharacterized membrane protein